MTLGNHLADALLAHGRAVPSAPFLRSTEGVEWSYADLLDRSAQFANALTGMAVLPGDRVAVQVGKSPDVIALHLGVIRAGAVYVPLNEQYTSAEVAALVDDADTSLVVTSTAVERRAIPFDDLRGIADRESTEFGDVPRAEDDPASILFTSGTTGRPKGAVMTHGNLAFSAQTLGAFWGFSNEDRLLHSLPLYHTHGLFVAVHLVLHAGAALTLLPRFDPDAVLDELPKCTVFMGVPTHYTRLLDHSGLTPDVCSGMRLFTSGSAPMLAKTHRALAERTGHHIVERYGMTETCILTSNPLDGERRPGSVGVALPGVDLRIAGGGESDVGSIQVRGPNVLHGYWRRPDTAATEFTADGWFVTGDLGRIDEVGYVEIVGRSKELIITGGLNVYPKEVELAIDRLPGVVESAVVGLPDPDFGERVAAAVVAEQAAGLTEDGVRAALRDELAGFKVPKQVVFVDALPRNAMGKVVRVSLREREGWT